MRDLSVSEYNHLIDEWVLNERERSIMKRRLIDGITYEALAEEFDMSVRGIKYLIDRNRKKLIKHL